MKTLKISRWTTALLMVLIAASSSALGYAPPPSQVPPGSGPSISSQEGPDWLTPDWLSSGLAHAIDSGPFGYPISLKFFDNRLTHDEWYPIARSFLDDTIYPTYYYARHQTTYIDGDWWNDPRGYRPLYKEKSGFMFMSS